MLSRRPGRDAAANARLCLELGGLCAHWPRLLTSHRILATVSSGHSAGSTPAHGPQQPQGAGGVISTLEARNPEQRGVEGLGTTWGLRGARDSPSPGDRWVSWPESGAKSLGLDQSGLDLPQGLGQGTSTTSKARTYQPGQPMAARWGSGQPGRPPADTPWSISQPSLAGRTRPFHMLAEPATPSAKNRETE